MQIEWTPGPWEVGIPDKRFVEIWSGSADRAVAKVWCGGRRNDADELMEAKEEQANAHLISAAPDLYDVVDALIKYMSLAGYAPAVGSNNPIEDLLARACFARQKARGDK